MNDQILRVLDLGSPEVKFAFFGSHWRCTFEFDGDDEWLEIDGRGDTPADALTAAIAIASPSSRP